MNSIGKGLLAAFVIGWSTLIFAGQEEEQSGTAPSTAVEQAAPAAAEPAAQSGEQALPSGIGWKLIRKLEMGDSGKFVNMVLIEKGRQADKTVYSSAIHRLCAKEQEFCRVRFWVQSYLVPEKVSLSLEQQKSQQADHLFNRTAGIHRTLWACTVDPTSESCIQ